MPASGQPAAASVAATRRMFSRPGVVVGRLGDELGDLVAVDRAVAFGLMLRMMLRDHFFELILGQRCALQQREQRHLVGPGDALRVAHISQRITDRRKLACL